MKKIVRGLILSLPSIFALSKPALAQTFTFDTARVPFTDLGKLLSNALILIFFFAAVLAFIFICIGGIQWITAGGDKGKVEQARAKITSGLTGVVIVISAIFIIELVGIIFGVEFLNITGMVTTLVNL